MLGPSWGLTMNVVAANGALQSALQIPFAVSAPGVGKLGHILIGLERLLSHNLPGTAASRLKSLAHGRHCDTLLLRSEVAQTRGRIGDRTNNGKGGVRNIKQSE